MLEMCHDQGHRLMWNGQRWALQVHINRSADTTVQCPLAITSSLIIITFLYLHGTSNNEVLWRRTAAPAFGWWCSSFLAESASDDSIHKMQWNLCHRQNDCDVDVRLILSQFDYLPSSSGEGETFVHGTTGVVYP